MTGTPVAAQEGGGSGEQPNTEVNDDPPADLSEAWDLIYDTVVELWKDLLRYLPLIVIAVLVFIAIWLVGRIVRAVVRSALDRAHLKNSLEALFLRLTGIAFTVLGLLTAATIIFPGLTPASLLTVAGLGSVAIGFAFKDIFENFFAGILILLRFPMERGDYIECGDIAGTIEEITVRMTILKTVTDELIVVPNATLFKNPVRVVTHEPHRRITVACGVAYDVDVATARQVITDAVSGCGSVSGAHPVQIFANEFGSSSINFEVTWWTESGQLDERQSKDEVVEAVKQALDNAGLEIPFPYRTLTFKEPLTTKSES